MNLLESISDRMAAANRGLTVALCQRPKSQVDGKCRTLTGRRCHRLRPLPKQPREAR